MSRKTKTSRCESLAGLLGWVEYTAARQALSAGAAWLLSACDCSSGRYRWRVGSKSLRHMLGYIYGFRSLLARVTSLPTVWGWKNYPGISWHCSVRGETCSQNQLHVVREQGEMMRHEVRLKNTWEMLRKSKERINKGNILFVLKPWTDRKRQWGHR